MEQNKRRRRTTRHRRQIRRARVQGMTLIEIMIVVVIMAMIAAAAGIGVMNAKKNMDKDTAKSEVHSLASVVEAYLLQNPKDDCPSSAALRQSRVLKNGGRAEDPWGTEYTIDCESGDVAVRSAGPNRQFGDEDDISNVEPS